MSYSIHIITSLNLGGTENFLSNLISMSDKKKHTVVSLKKKTANDVIFDKNVNVIYLNFSSNFFLNLFQIIKLYKILKNTKFSSLNLWLYHSYLLGSLLSIRKKNRKIIWHVRCNYRLYKKNLSSMLNLYLCKIYLMFNKNVLIVFNSESSRTSHIAKGFTAINIIIHNGVDENKFNNHNKTDEIIINNHLINKNQFNIGMISRFHPDKNHEVFFKALKKFQSITKNFIIILAGIDINNHNKRLLYLINKYQLTDKVLLLGVVKNIHELIPYFDINVLTSKSESFPNNIVEAMSCAVPSIASNIDNIPDIIDDCGFVFKEGDSEECYLMIKLFYLKYYNKNILIRLKEKNRKRVIENYNISNTLNEFNRIW